MQGAIDAVFIIHAEGSATRLQNALRLKDCFGPLAEILSAVTPETKDYEGHRYQAGGLHKPRYPFQLSTREVATFLSHRKAWNEILKRRLKTALVVEDDVELASGFDDALALASKSMMDWSLIRFPWRKREAAESTIAQGEQAILFKPKSIGLGMICQLVSEGAARKLISATDKFDRPVDTFMQLHWLHKVEVRSVWPSGVSEISHTMGGSLIHAKKRSISSVINKEIRRPIYRGSLRLHQMWRPNAP
jgi:GR25 family glycosyltransferase involved in LPS biosynthesis